jgi:hypothetical protein
MKSWNRTIVLIGCVASGLLGLPGCGNDSGETATSTSTDSTGRCPHEIKQDKCPFCNPDLVASEGFCGDHGVEEALCYQCRPYLNAAFRAKGDWCEEHSAPDSQCLICHPELRENIRAGEHGTQNANAGNDSEGAAENCEHGIAQAKCPFCTPSLIESAGFCTEHNVAEALCVACRPYLEAAFRAERDWCEEHATPESQCAICNPELIDDAGGNQG